MLDRYAKYAGRITTIDCSFKTLAERHTLRGPVCHVGSLINKPGEMQNKAERWRRGWMDLTDSQEFVGIDLFPGPNVDIVTDLCAKDFPDAHPELMGRFATVICWALLEHVKNPFEASANIEKLIAPGGHLLYSTPWVWGYHAYPGDYFRISFDGLAALFPDLEWRQRWYYGTVPDVGLEMPPEIETGALRQYTVEGPASAITDIALPFVNLGAVGLKSAGVECGPG